MKPCLLIFIFLLLSHNSKAAEGAYEVELLFDYSRHTESWERHNRGIQSHDARFVKLKSKDLQAAMAEAKALIGTTYTGTVHVTLCNLIDIKNAPEKRPECFSTTNDSRIVGVVLMTTTSKSSARPICLYGDAKVGDLIDCSGKFPSKEPVKSKTGTVRK